MRANEIAHHANAFRIIENDHGGPVLPKKIFSTLEVLIFPNDDAGNPKQQGGASAHDARAERAHQSQFCPVSPAAGVTKAYRFGVGRGISALYSQVVPTGHDLPMLVR